MDTEHAVVSVIDYEIDDGRNVEAGPFRLLLQRHYRHRIRPTVDGGAVLGDVLGRR